MRILVAALAVAGIGLVAFTTTTSSGQVIAPYVVVLADGTDVRTKVDELERTHSFRAEHRYTASIAGFAARLAPRQREAIAHDPSVAAIHEDKATRLSPPARSTRTVALATGVRRIGGGAKAAAGGAGPPLGTGGALAPPGLPAPPG